MQKPLILSLGFLLLAAGCNLFRTTVDPVPTPQMTNIGGGTFVMGDIYDAENTDAMPVHQVTLTDFRIGTYEVTYRQYDAFAKRTGRKRPQGDSLQRSNRAVVYVSWKDAQSFCKYHGWRLPTEQEWEYAARSGGNKMRYAGTNNVDSLKAYGRTTTNSAPFSFRVGTKRPNNAGLYDMSGNVFEWIGAYYQFYPENGVAPSWDKLKEGTIRIIRGGSFAKGSNVAATYWRVGVLANSKMSDVGFRCVDPLNEQK